MPCRIWTSTNMLGRFVCWSSKVPLERSRQAASMVLRNAQLHVYSWCTHHFVAIYPSLINHPDSSNIEYHEPRSHINQHHSSSNTNITIHHKPSWIAMSAHQSSTDINHDITVNAAIAKPLSSQRETQWFLPIIVNDGLGIGQAPGVMFKGG